jgi:hypothetical protein
VVPGPLTALEGLTLSFILALAGTVLVGYRFGDSNHGITVPILKRLMDPSLYPGDVMVATAERFPTIFYRTLAALLPSTDWIPFAFFSLYVVSIAATLAGAYRIGSWAGGPAAGVVALLFAFPVKIGLAGEALYRVAFSHSHLASALVIWAIVWFLEGRRLLPLLALSLGAYNHVLYSAYVLVPLLIAVLVERRQAGWRRTATLVAAGVLPLVPIAIYSISRGTPMTPEWLELLRLRSALHSFPSAFEPDLPQSAALLALALLACSTASGQVRALFAVFLVGVALQFTAGTLLTELHPVKAVLQYQPHRSWRFLLLLLYGLIASSVVSGFRGGGLARISALFTGGVVLAPGLESLLPLAVVAQAFAARPAPAIWSRLAAAAVLVFVGGWGDRPLDYTSFLSDLVPRFLSTTVLLAAAIALLLRIGYEKDGLVRPLWALVGACLTLFWLAPSAYARQRARWESGDWRDVQNWVRVHTPKTASFLTPPRGDQGFRVFSERTIVGEWKDGTQQYFDDSFAREWGARMDLLGGDAFVKLPDDELLHLARRFGASYLVLPARRARASFTEVYSNRYFVVYRVR